MSLSKKINALSVCAFIALSSAAYAQSTGATSDKADATATSKKSAVSESDQKMMFQLAQANMAEVATGELAQTKSTNDQVIKFGKQMVDDHSQALKDLKKLADDRDVKLPAETDAKHQAALKKLNALSGTGFDREYIKLAVQDHQDAKKLVQKIHTAAKDVDFKAMGGKLIPTIDMHLKMSKELKAK